jgi:hypothetical protein
VVSPRGTSFIKGLTRCDISVRGRQLRPQRGGIQGQNCFAVRADAFRRLDHPLVQHFRKHDMPVEQARPRLRGDPQCIAKSARDYQQRTLALTLQKRVRGNRGAHLHAGHPLWGDRIVLAKPEQPAHSLQGRIVVLGGILRQKFQGVQRLIRCASDHIREGSAPVYPELPTAHVSTTLSAARTRPRVSGIAKADSTTSA